MTLKRRGISSSVSVTSSPSFDSREPPQQAHVVADAAMTMRSHSIFSGHGLRTGRWRVKARTDCVLVAASSAASSSSAADATSSSSCNSNWSIRRCVRSRRGPCLSRPSFPISNCKCAFSASMLDSRAFALAASASASIDAARSASSTAWALARSDGSESGGNVMPTLNQISQQSQCINPVKPVLAARFPAALASRFRTEDRTVAPVRPPPCRLRRKAR